VPHVSLSETLGFWFSFRTHSTQSIVLRGVPVPESVGVTTPHSSFGHCDNDEFRPEKPQVSQTETWGAHTNVRSWRGDMLSLGASSGTMSEENVATRQSSLSRSLQRKREVGDPMGKNSERPYTKSGRLADVLALIQVLALDKYTHRSESGLLEELQGSPSSSQSWIGVGSEHPEFFRVAKDRELSLIARHVVPRDSSTGTKELPSDLIYPLLQTAIDLHDRQVSAAEWWKSLIPLWAALIGGILVAVPTLITLWLKTPKSP
jgi:hypothetical protein